MKYTDSYDDRQSVPDMADEAMQQYLKDAGLVEFKDWLKIGTDPKENKLDLDNTFDTHISSNAKLENNKLFEKEVIKSGSDVSAGEVIEKKIGKKYNVKGAVTQLGILGCDIKKWDDRFISKNPFFCPDKSILKLWEKYLLSIRKSGSSCGAVIEVRARGIPVGLGAPIYSKLDMDLAAAMMSINAVKGVNIGSGMNSAQLTGEQNSDEMSKKGKSTLFKSNNAGGILGGISSGQEIILSFAVKPTSSILTKRKTIDKFGKNTSISVKGRHDPCVGIRAVPIGEAMMNCVLLDHFLMHNAQCKN